MDVTLPIAGVGTRAYAFLIDWHIRVLLALAWALIGWLLMRSGVIGGGGGGLNARPLLTLFFALPISVLYFLYHPVLELLLRGTTPGKRIAGARIVTREGATPGSAALLIRNVFRLIDTVPAFYLLGLGFCLCTAQRVRIGDLAAGTVLVIDESRLKRRSLERMGALVERSRLEPRAAALIQDVLDRWWELEPSRREQLARGLLEKLGGASRDQLQNLGEAQLHIQLQGLLERA